MDIHVPHFFNMTPDKEINHRLLNLYGRCPITNRPKYRVVWGPFETEKRYGSYDVLTDESGIFLGSRTGLVEIKKYWYLKDCWILERVEPNLRGDLFHDKFTYEPLLPFLDKDDNMLPLAWRPIEFLIGKLERAERRVMLTEEDHRAEEEKKQKKEEEQVYAFLDKPDPVKELPTFQSSVLMGYQTKSVH